MQELIRVEGAESSFQDRCPYCNTLLEGGQDALSIYNSTPYRCPSCGGEVALVASGPRKFSAMMTSGIYAILLAMLAGVGIALIYHEVRKGSWLSVGLVSAVSLPFSLWCASRAVASARVWQRVRARRLLPVSRAGEVEVARWERRKPGRKELRGSLSLLESDPSQKRGALRIVDQRGALEMLEPVPRSPGDSA